MTDNRIDKIKDCLSEVTEISDEKANKFLTFFERMVETNEVMNLTAITEFDEVIVKHFLDSVYLLKNTDISSKKILDLGTGSGILSIICDKLGAGKIEAIDIDPLAVDVARENCIINGCEDIDCYAGELKDAKASDYSIVVANIIADIIAAIASDVPSKLKEGGRFVCSGIINTKKEKVEQALKDAGFTILEKHEKNDWMAYVCALT